MFESNLRTSGTEPALRNHATDELSQPIDDTATVEAGADHGTRITAVAAQQDENRGRLSDLDQNAFRIEVLAIPRWKRWFDVIAATALLLILSPLLVLVVAIIKFTSGRPILFRQKRAGLAGRPFVLLKFRSMVRGAEKQQNELRHLNEQDGPAFKIKHDPRVTRLGRMLRASCVDELPQLWNILRGEMSFVGPRPLPLREAAQCKTWQQRRHSVTPGLTCFWQARRQRPTSFDEWMKLDLRYIRERSPSCDVKILLATALAILSWTCADLTQRARVNTKAVSATEEESIPVPTLVDDPLKS